MSVDLASLVRCPACRGSLSSNAGLECSACLRTYQVIDGIPILVPDLAMTEHDELGQDHSHKAAQAGHFDQALAEEFEITRPHGTPRLYEFLIREKLGRAVAPIRPDLVGATALTVCGGSGMDAEFLAEAGCRVVSSDLSLGAARRTQERARRFGAAITAIVADVEHLPFADEAFDLVLVHDGLHHLEHPEAGLVEIARVARRWVSISEPARAVATAVAVRTGLALEREEAGNVVARMRPTDVVDSLATLGFRPLRAERYAMYYRHEPGVVSRMLSHRFIFPVVRWGWRIGNAVLGRVGNKMVVVGERRR